MSCVRCKRSLPPASAYDICKRCMGKGIASPTSACPTAPVYAPAPIPPTASFTARARATLGSAPYRAPAPAPTTAPVTATAPAPALTRTLLPTPDPVLAAHVPDLTSPLRSCRLDPTPMPPPEKSPEMALKAFMTSINLQKHLEHMEATGYDDVDDFRQMTASELDACASALASRGVPPGHVGRIIRAMRQVCTPVRCIRAYYPLS